MQEFEGTFLNIDKGAIESRLRELGAEHKGEQLYRTTTFDYAGFPLDQKAAWVRLRDEGDKVTLAFKQRLGVTSETGDDTGMLEHEIVVSDFDTTAAILQDVGLIVKFSMEQKRSRWVLGDVTFDIDTRPLLQPYLEIESDSDAKVDAAAEQLGLAVSNKKTLSATQVYALSGIRDKDYIKIGFDEQIKRKS
jgi:adenylate cyclase class 2